MIFEDEDTRTFFHLLEAETQILFYEIEELLQGYGKRLAIDDCSLDENNELELVLRVIE